MHTIYSLLVWGILSGEFPNQGECIRKGEYLKSIDATVEYVCPKTRGRISWQQLK